LPAVSIARFAAPPPGGVLHVREAIFVALFAAQGFEVTPVPAGETRDAGRVMPFAIVFALVGASLLYVAVQAVVVGAHPGLAVASETPLAEAALAVSPRLGVVVAWGGIVSTLGFVAGNAFGTPRYAFAMAEDGALPRALSYVDPRRGAPLAAIALTCTCAAVLTASFPARALVGISNLAVAVQYLGTCFAVALAAARARRHGALAVAALGALVSCWILTQGDAVERRTAAACLLVGVLVGALSRARGSGR
jgi:amino acid transporter